jgi:hypothetical protein
MHGELKPLSHTGAKANWDKDETDCKLAGIRTANFHNKQIRITDTSRGYFFRPLDPPLQVSRTATRCLATGTTLGRRKTWKGGRRDDDLDLPKETSPIECSWGTQFESRLSYKHSGLSCSRYSLDTTSKRSHWNRLWPPTSDLLSIQYSCFDAKSAGGKTQ